MDRWTNSSKIEWKSLPCLIETECTVELSLNDLTYFVLESEHLKISSQKMPKSKATNLQWLPRPPLRLAGFWEPWRLSIWRKKLPQIKHWWLLHFYWWLLLVGKSYYLLFTICMHFSFLQCTPSLLLRLREKITSESMVLNVFRQWFPQPDLKRLFPGFTISLMIRFGFRA